MTFLNFYISIFNKKIKPSLFLSLFFLLVIMVPIASFSLHQADISLNVNDVIRKYQISKIEESDFINASTIIIGDSSGGNAIDADYLTKISGINSISLSLTASWGIIGSLGILKKSIQKNKNIKNIIIIHSADIWTVEFPRESILELFSISNIYSELGLKQYFTYQLNPKELILHAKHFRESLLNSLDIEGIDQNNDYIKQNKELLNDHRMVERLGTLDNLLSTNNMTTLFNDKIRELKMLQSFCKKQSLNCIFINGPIPTKLHNNSDKYFTALDNNVFNKFEITFIDKIFKYPNEYLGDTYNHIDPKYKKEVTEDYYNEIKDYLVAK